MMFWDNGGRAWWQAGPMWLAAIALLALLTWIVHALVTGITRQPDQAWRDATPAGSGAFRRL